MNQVKKSSVLIMVILFIGVLVGYAASAIAEDRPSGNTGKGFFTIGHKIYDANGEEFIPRGVNAEHWGGNDGDALHRAAIPYIKKSGANAVRIVFGEDTGDGWNNLNQTSAQREEVIKRYIDNHIVPIYAYAFDGKANEQQSDYKIF